MASRGTLVHPILFSQRFALDPSVFDKAKLLDPILNSDTKLFIDPLLIMKSGNALIKKRGRAAIKKGFQDVLSLVDISQVEGDTAWKAAYRALNLDERFETGLGYGSAGTSGNSRPRAVRTTILKTAKEIIELGEKNPDVIPLMALFEEGVGPDTLSDLSTNFLLHTLAEITEAFSHANSIPTVKYGPTYDNRELPENPFRPGSPVILVPRDLLRDLPLAADWSDVSRVVMEVDEIRDAVNALVGSIAKASVKEKKKAVRAAALSSADILRAVLDAIAAASESYDEKADLDGFYTFRKLLYSDPQRFVGLAEPSAINDENTLRATVIRIIEEFKALVENNNMWELLWYNETPRHERASQLLFFAVANIICSINNVDISPETNSGGGPVDFKFSSGYHGRLLVEMKLSTGRVVHGYEKQLEIYKQASATKAGIFVVMDVGGMGRKLRDIEKLKALAEARGETASEIFVIDAGRRASASKRK